MRWRGARWAALLCLSSSLARAQSYWVDLAAPPSCPGVAQLQSEVAVRPEAPRLVPDAPHTRVEVSKSDTGYYVARAAFPDGEERELEAVNCQDVLSALAFVIVMRAGRHLQEVEPQPASVEAEPSPQLANELPPPRLEWSNYMGASAGALGGRTPDWMPTVGAFWELWQQGEVLDRGARAGISVGAGKLTSSPAPVSLRSLAATVDLCPIGASFAALCAGVELGAIEVSSGRALSNTEALRFSMSGHVGALLRAVYHERWLGEIGGGINLPITLDEFVIQRRDGTFEPIHTVGVSGYAGVSVGYRL